MLFNFPTFISAKEQTASERLYNNLKIMVQTHIQEIWVNLDFGTNIRNLLKQGIDNIMLAEIRDELETKIYKYFSNDLVINNLDVWQNTGEYSNVVRVDLEYTELKTGIIKTVQSEEIILNKDSTLY